MAELDPDINHFRRLLDDSKRVVVFTGAGISAESGIPTFRDADGFWERFDALFGIWSRATCRSLLDT